MGVGIGAPFVGIAVMTASCDPHYTGRTGVYYDCGPDVNMTPLLMGMGVGLAAWVYGIADAGKAADRANARLYQAPQVQVAPTVAAAGRTAAPGLALQVRF